MLRLGMHVSIAGGLEKAADRAREKGCDAFQIFTTNPRSWRSKPIPLQSIDLFSSRLKEYDLHPVVSHMPYLPNLASPQEEVYSKSVKALTDELVRCRLLGIPYLVTHLGSDLGAEKKNGKERIAEA
ncbi:MAG: TIM barrel protein, partial [Methanothrix sp.]